MSTTISFVSGCASTQQQDALTRINKRLNTLHTSNRIYEQKLSRLSNTVVLFKQQITQLKAASVLSNENKNTQAAEQSIADDIPHLPEIVLTAPAPFTNHQNRLSHPTRFPSGQGGVDGIDPIELSLAGDTKSSFSWATETVPAKDLSAADNNNIGDPNQIFTTAMQHYSTGQISRAKLLLNDFIISYSSHADCDDALFWLGKMTEEGRAKRQAINFYEQLLNQFPASGKVPDTMLRIGIVRQQLGHTNKSIDIFKRLVAQYPNSAAADLGQRRLRALRPKASGRNNSLSRHSRQVSSTR